MATLTGNVDQVTDLLVRGIREDLSKSIEAKIHAEVDSMIKELAVEYAKKVAVHLTGLQTFDAANGRVVLNLRLVVNNKEVPVDIN